MNRKHFYIGLAIFLFGIIPMTYGLEGIALTCAVAGLIKMGINY